VAARGLVAATAPPQPVALAEARAQASIAIVERLPAYRHGLALGLAAHGFEVEERSALDEDATDFDVLVVTVDEKADWSALAELAQTPERPALVALLENPSVAHYRRALCLGLEGAVPRDAAIEQIVGAVEAALTGIMLLPSPIARQLADGSGVDEPLPISDCEIGWLRAMAEGATIAKMAQAARYSERQMHRLIANLYKRIGAANRQQALVFAARYGILDD
jgi:DNA-binding NarL/FixJ family response regulator